MNKKVERKAKNKEHRKCGVNTCIYYVLGKCELEQCDMFENGLMQEW